MYIYSYYYISIYPIHIYARRGGHAETSAVLSVWFLFVFVLVHSPAAAHFCFAYVFVSPRRLLDPSALDFPEDADNGPALEDIAGTTITHTGKAHTKHTYIYTHAHIKHTHIDRHLPPFDELPYGRVLRPEADPPFPPSPLSHTHPARGAWPAQSCRHGLSPEQHVPRGHPAAALRPRVQRTTALPKDRRDQPQGP